MLAFNASSVWKHAAFHSNALTKVVVPILSLSVIFAQGTFDDAEEPQTRTCYCLKITTHFLLSCKEKIIWTL
jgi:hypothetical protein